MPPVKYHLGKFPPVNLDWTRLVPLLGPAYTAIARYDGALCAVPNANVLLSPLMTQEAVLSSRIEGTITTFKEVLEFEAGAGLREKAGISPKSGDIHEVLNYRRAINYAVDRLKDLPISGRLLRETHDILLEGVRDTQDFERSRYAQSALQIFRSKGRHSRLCRTVERYRERKRTLRLTREPQAGLWLVNEGYMSHKWPWGTGMSHKTPVNWEI